MGLTRPLDKKSTCSRCGKQGTMSNGYCRSCHAQYLRQWRKSHPLTEEQRRKRNVRTAARNYQLRGKLRQKPCRHCGESRSERHHPDYARPLFVIWLCRPCHLKLHARKRQAARRASRHASPAPAPASPVG